jgi:hypothetical protein
MQLNNFQILLSVFSLIFVGYIAKTVKTFDEDFAKKSIKFLFFLPLPILVFLSFATTKLDLSLSIYPIILIIIQSILIIISYLIGRLLKFSNKTLGTLIASAGITSTLVFALPFIQAFYGVENLKYLFMYDFGNGLMAWTIVYLITGYLGNKKQLGIKKGILISAVSPAAALAVAFSIKHDLDQKFASALVAFTMVLGIILVPLIILL